MPREVVVVSKHASSITKSAQPSSAKPIPRKAADSTPAYSLSDVSLNFIAKVDPISGCTYFVNLKTKTTSWTAPEGWNSSVNIFLPHETQVSRDSDAVDETLDPPPPFDDGAFKSEKRRSEKVAARVSNTQSPTSSASVFETKPSDTQVARGSRSVDETLEPPPPFDDGAFKPEKRRSEKRRSEKATSGEAAQFSVRPQLR